MNKTLFIIAILLAACITGCTERKQQTTKSDWDIQHISFAKKDNVAEVEISIDYPTTDSKLATAVKEYINKELGNSYTGSLKNGKELANFYAKNMIEEIKERDKNIDIEIEGTSSYQHTITVAYNEQRWLTMTSDLYSYSKGAAHGIGATSGCTFCKKDGTQMGYNMLNITDSVQFRQLIVNGLKEYFTEYYEQPVETDDALEAILMIDNGINSIPLPATEPYLTPKGMHFIYQSYEIACYADGRPSFTIPYSDIKPFLTKTAKDII